MGGVCHSAMDAARPCGATQAPSSATRDPSPHHGMSRPGRLALLLLPVLVSLGAQSMPGRAQTPPSSRFAFADTTLLRDTLGLRFDRLFEVADSMQALPDSVRALMIRYRLTLPRLVAMVDSIGMPIDSLGPSLERERYNPFASRGPGQQLSRRNFRYSSGYTIQRTSTSWSNGGDFDLSQGAYFLRNYTNTLVDRYRAGGLESVRQTRDSNTELGWFLNRELSLGSRVILSRFYTKDPSSTSNEGEAKNEFQLSSRYKSGPGRRMAGELNGFGGYLDLSNRQLIKRGLSGSLDGRLRAQRGTWLSHDLSGSVNGNASRTRRPEVAAGEIETRDLNSSARGVLNLYNNKPISLLVNYSIRRSRVESPTESLSVNRILTAQQGADATIRIRQASDRYVNLTSNVGRSSQQTGTRDDFSYKAQGRYAIKGWQLDADYGDTHAESDFPRQRRSYGYRETQDGNSANGTLTKPFGVKFVTKVTSAISLSRYRYSATADSATPPAPRDAYRQNYRIELLYNRSERLNSRVALDVGLTRSINLLPQSVTSNSDTRSYRSEWSWSYRILRGLTVTQTNSLTADYRFYPFSPNRNDVSLDYNTITNLSTLLTPRLTLDLQHVARAQPRGSYVREADGLEYLQPADENLNYTLRGNITYSPSSALSLTLRPEYQASDRNGTVNGVETAQRSTRRLNFSGGANLNVAVGSKGLVTGGIQRSYNADRTITYEAGEPVPTPRSETDFWNGSLQFSWQL